MAGMYSSDAPGVVEHASVSLPFTPYDARWMPVRAHSHTSMCVVGAAPSNGCLYVAKLTQSGVERIASVTRRHPLKCVTFGASPLGSAHACVGDFGGNVSIIDLERAHAPVASSTGATSVSGSQTHSQTTPELSAPTLWDVTGHTGVVNCVAGIGGVIGGGAPEIATGGRDGCVKVWDPRVREAVVSLEPAEGEAVRDCWSVAFGHSFGDDDRAVAAAYDNGDVKVFDLRMNAMRMETNVGNGAVCVEFDRPDTEMNKLLVTTLESKFRVYDMRTQHPSEGFAFVSEKAHKSTVWLGRHLPQNRDIFVTTGGNGGINIYRYIYPDSRSVRDAEGQMRGVAGTVELLNARVVSSQPIVGFDWHSEKEGLACTVALDQTLRVFIVTKLNKY